MDRTPPDAPARAAWLAGGVSVAVDAIALSLITDTTIYQCFDGYTNRWTAFRNPAIVVGFVACAMLVIVIGATRGALRRIQLVACTVIILAATSTVGALWQIVQHRTAVYPCGD